jgi:iron-sulfur cluster assembly accessory protein
MDLSPIGAPTGALLTLAAVAPNYHAGAEGTKSPIGGASGYHSQGQSMTDAMTSDLTMTDRAARRIGEILKSEPSGAMLRLSVLGGGCSGFQYKFDVEREKADDDVTIVRGGVTMLVDSVSLGFLAGSEIDYVDDLIGASFKVNNPKAKASCGCGTSFSL